MAFAKGHAKLGGRRKGIKNRRTLAEAACSKAGIDPFDLLVKHAVDGDIGAIIQLCKHIEPPRKPLDMAVDPEESTIRCIIEDYRSPSSSEGGKWPPNKKPSARR